MKPFLPFIIVGICVGMYFMYISPMISDISIERAKKAEYTRVLSSTKELKDKRDSLTASYNEISQENLALLNKIIPTDFDSAVFANDVSSIASRNGITVMDLKVDVARTRERNLADDGTASNYRIVTTNMRVSGPYDRFVSFLKDLESSLQLIDVVNLNITSTTGQRPTDLKFEYKLEINTYSLQ